MSTLTEQALAQVRTAKPQSFTVGGTWDGQKLQGGLTYDRTWRNGWGLTAYARAWYEDAPVSTHTKRLKTEAGVEAVKKF